MNTTFSSQLGTSISTSANAASSMKLTSTEDRALSLLGSGVTAEQTAAALGVTPSAISQLLSNAEFSKQVETLRYENLQRHNVRDSAYDTLEDKLLEKLESNLGFLVRPESILKAIQVVNNAKRRGQSAPEQVNNQSTVTNLLMPTVVMQQFTANVNNQIIKAGGQDLLTIPSNSLLNKIEGKGEASSVSNTVPPSISQKQGIPNDITPSATIKSTLQLSK